jgi:hypothetical protein
MTEYQVELFFSDADDNYYTKGQGSVVMTVRADDLATAHALATRLQRVLLADHFQIEK